MIDVWSGRMSGKHVFDFLRVFSRKPKILCGSTAHHGSWWIFMFFLFLVSVLGHLGFMSSECDGEKLKQLDFQTAGASGLGPWLTKFRHFGTQQHPGQGHSFGTQWAWCVGLCANGFRENLYFSVAHSAEASDWDWVDNCSNCCTNWPAGPPSSCSGSASCFKLPEAIQEEWTAHWALLERLWGPSRRNWRASFVCGNSNICFQAYALQDSHVGHWRSRSPAVWEPGAWVLSGLGQSKVRGGGTSASCQVYGLAVVLSDGSPDGLARRGAVGKISEHAAGRPHGSPGSDLEAMLSLL